MARIALTGGAYQARSLIASAQRCVNLVPEANPQPGDVQVPVTHYPRPGLREIARQGGVGAGRALYTASNGDLYQVIAGNVFYVDASFNYLGIGRVVDSVGAISFADNGQVIVLCDGTKGYVIDMATHNFAQITAAGFLGSAFVVCVDTYFVFHQPGTANMYISLSQVSGDNLGNGAINPNATYAAFDPSDIARKAGQGDRIAALAAVHRELWLIGEQTSEVWANTGAADFTFAPIPGAFIDHGCVAPGSVATQDISVFFVSRDRQGVGIVVQGQGYSVERISTHAIEAAFQAYPRLDDATAYTFQQQGHVYYVLSFPAANRTWAYDLNTKQWSEWAWTDKNGGENRHRARACAFAYGLNLCSDWQNGALYAFDPDTFDDDGDPIVCLRTFPHLVNDGKRVTFDSFIADMQVGTLAGSSADDPPKVSLRWSDTRGASYGNAIQQSLGAAGQFDTSILWNRLGMARDRVFELSWSAPVRTALNGAFVETSASET